MEELDLWAMQPGELRSLIREEAAKIAQPLQGALESQQALLQARAVQEAMLTLPAVLEQYGISHMCEDATFREAVRGALTALDPELLRDRRAIASCGLASLASSGAGRRAGARTANTQRPTPSPDAAAETGGRFLEHYTGSGDAAEWRALEEDNIESYHAALRRQGRTPHKGRR